MSRLGMRVVILALALSVAAIGPACVRTVKFYNPNDPSTVPVPLAGPTGKYLCPYRADKGRTAWLQKAMDSGIAGGKSGGFAALMCQHPDSMPPGIPDPTEATADEEERTEAALQIIGGAEYMRSSSDLSFNRADDLVIYIQSCREQDPDYAWTIAIAAICYPDIRDTWQYRTVAAMMPVRPIEGNTGKYMCPYTSDGTVAEWVDKGSTSGIMRKIGGVVGAEGGKRVVESVPFVGGLLGGKIGGALGQGVALKAVGGWDAIRESSDLSFNDSDDMVQYVYRYYSKHPDFMRVVELTGNIYPELQKHHIYQMVMAWKANPELRPEGMKETES